MPATSPSQRNGSYSTAIIRSHAAYGDLAWGPVVGSWGASSVTPRTYEQPGSGSIAQFGHLSRMAVFGYLTRARDARPRRRRPSETGDRACGVCSRRGGARYAGSTRAAPRSRDRRDRARPKPGFGAPGLTPGPARRRPHPFGPVAVLSQLGGPRGTRKPRAP